MVIPASKPRGGVSGSPPHSPATHASMTSVAAVERSLASMAHPTITEPARIDPYTIAATASCVMRTGLAGGPTARNHRDEIVRCMPSIGERTASPNGFEVEVVVDDAGIETFADVEELVYQKHDYTIDEELVTDSDQVDYAATEVEA